jgi:hypothetical protein
MDTPTTPNTPQTPPRSNLPTDVARLPIPGNAELLIYILALIVAMFVTWISDSLGSPSWLEFFRWTTVAYIISRGIAKASRVLEQ